MFIYTNEKTPGLRTEDGGIKIFPTLLATLYVAVAALFISLTVSVGALPISEYAQLLLSIAMPVLGIALCTRITGSIRALLPYCIITGLLLFMGTDILLSSALAVFILLLAVCAYLFHNGFWVLALVSGVVAGGATYLLTQSILSAVFTLAFLPTAVALYFSFKKRMQRVQSVCTLTVTLALTLVLSFIVWIYLAEGVLSADVLKNFFTELKDGVTLGVVTALDVAAKQLSTTISITDATAVATLSVTMLFNLLPAILTMILFVVTYIAHSLYVSLLSATSKDASDVINAITFKMSVSSAVIFLVAYFAALILEYEGAELYATVAQNVYLMLFPGLSLVAFGFVGSFMKAKGASCLTSIIYFALFGIILFIPNVAAGLAGGVISIAAFVGAVLVIVSAAKAKFESNNKNNKDNK